LAAEGRYAADAGESSVAIDYSEDSDLGGRARERPGFLTNSPAYLQQRHSIPAELMQNIAVIEALASKAAE